MDFRVPVVWDAVVVIRNSLFVRVFVVVEVRRVVDEQRRLVADGLESVPAVTGNADDLLVVFADDERVEFALRGRVLAVVVDAHRDSTLRTDEVVDLALKMAMPSSHDSGVRHRVVGHLRVDFVFVPVATEHFDQMAALVGVDLEVANFDVVDVSHLFSDLPL